MKKAIFACRVSDFLYFKTFYLHQNFLKLDEKNALFRVIQAFWFIPFQQIIITYNILILQAIYINLTLS